MKLQNSYDEAISLLKGHVADAPYYGRFSGGKDSIVIHRLCQHAGVSVDWNYSVTQIDPPPLTQFIRREYPDVRWIRQVGRTFFKDIVRYGLPSRRLRWCCKIYKENTNPNGRTLLMGVRAAESARRAAHWQSFGLNRNLQMTVLPIFNWTDAEVWEFIRAENIPYCHLYDEGKKRLGCIACPMARPRDRADDMRRYPGFEKQFRRAANLRWPLIDSECETKRAFSCGDEWFDWWLSNELLPSTPCGQDNILFDFMEAAWNEEQPPCGGKE